MASTFRCFLVEKDSSGAVSASVQELPMERLGDDEVLIRVHWSSVNYKDGLAATGHSGIVRRFPHVPGIDAMGEVVESRSESFRAGQQVIVTSYDLGAGHWGGWSEWIRVPAKWVVPLPAGLSSRESMVLGTAGFTAALCVAALESHGIQPDAGEVLVTGATGGVGCLAIHLLKKLGYQVVAASGKPQMAGTLRSWGAARVIGRDEVCDTSSKPLLNTHWAGAIDTVGGKTLATIVRQLKWGGCVAACGLVGGTDLTTTVYPFLLRGVTLAGIDSAAFPMDRRLRIWQQLASQWRLEGLDDFVTEITLSELQATVSKILRGEIAGRVVVRLAGN